MPGPPLPAVDLLPEERQGLEALARAHTAPQQVARRARVILLAADGLNNCQIARHLGLEADTVRLWRQRWRALQGLPLADLPVLDRLTDAPRRGRPAQIQPAQVCQIVQMACDAPHQSGRPISQWTSREIADEVMRRGIVPTISPRHAARLLQKGTSSRTASAIG